MNYLEITWACFVESLLSRDGGCSDTFIEAFRGVIQEAAAIAVNVPWIRRRDHIPQ